MSLDASPLTYDDRAHREILNEADSGAIRNCLTIAVCDFQTLHLCR